MAAPSPVIVAMDYSDLASVEAMADQLDPSLCRLKVGKELFTYCGPDIVRRLQQKGFEIFLDLKFHDIPNTVAGAVKAAADLGVWMVNVHASGGVRMMETAKNALVNYPSPPKLIAVTVLTSMETQDLCEVGISTKPLEQVKRLATLSKRCGLDGVVCSAQEVSILRDSLPEEFLLVTPGIRPTDTECSDQRRIATPSSAMAMGSSYLVIGRPITQAAQPLETLKTINAQIQAG